MMIIEPTGGLCNRLRALDSAIAYATEKNIKLCVFWILNAEFNSRFCDLFLVPKGIKRIAEIKFTKIYRIFQKILNFNYSHFPDYFVGNDAIEKIWLQTGSEATAISNLINRIDKKKFIYIQTCYRFFYSSSSAAYSHIVPQADVQNFINNYKTENMIGVHIRRTDNAKSTLYSPIDGFIECMKVEIQKDSDVKFFVATDDLESETTIKEKFPGRIITHTKRSLDRNYPIALKDAVIDLYCLANCRKLIGSYWSSFTNVASEIHGIEKTIIRSENR